MSLRKACRHARGLSGDARLRAWKACGCVWMYRHTVDGRRVDTSLQTSDYAEARRRHARATGGQAPAPSGRTVADVAARWELVTEQRVAASTMTAYRPTLRHVVNYLGNLDVSEVTGAHLNELEADLIRVGGLSPLYARNAKGVALAVLGHAEEAGLITGLPRARRRRTTASSKRERRFLDRAELGRLLEVESPIRELFGIGALTGLRPGELLALRPVDFDTEARVLRVRRKLQGRTNLIENTLKTQAGRRDVDLPDEVLALMRRVGHMTSASRMGPKRMSARAVPPEERLWPVHYSTALEFWHDACERAEIADEGGLHTLRHTNAAMRIALGQDLVYIAEQLGHRDPSVTLREYGHLVERERRDASGLAFMLHVDPPAAA